MMDNDELELLRKESAGKDRRISLLYTEIEGLKTKLAQLELKEEERKKFDDFVRTMMQRPGQA